MHCVMVLTGVSHGLVAFMVWTENPPGRSPSMSMASLPPRLELVVLLAGAVVGYNLTMQYLPSQRINLGQIEAQDRLDRGESWPASAAKSSQPAAPSDAVSRALALGSGVCTVPAGGGPALNERFEPC